jgi:hypothetical protein
MLTKKSMLTLSLFAGAILFTGCFEDNNPTGPDNATGGKLFVVESDYQSGLVEWLTIEGSTLGTGNLSVYSDACVRTYGGYLYILERFGADNVIKFDPSKTDESGVLYQTHLGDNWNPQDIEFVSETKAYIANQNEPKITIFNPTAGTVTDNIDISAYTFNPDSNASPYANQMALSEGKLYVMLQRRDGWNPGAPTLIITINTSTDAISAADTIACQYKNGFDMVCVDGVLYVTNPGSAFSTGDGGIEKIDLSTKTVTTIIDETALGGNPNQIVHKSGSRFYVQNYIGWKNVSVVEIDASSGAVVTTLPEITDAFGGICYDSESEKLYVGERDSIDVGIRVFEDNAQVAGPVKSSNSLPPAGMVIVR